MPQLKASSHSSLRSSANLKSSKESFFVKREIGRGSYGVVFKAMRSDSDDTDENGNRRQYAVKRIFPTINAAFILVEMLILKLVDGKQNNADLI